MANKGKYKPKIFVPCASVSPSSITRYSYPIEGWQKTQRFTENMANLEDNSHDGIISWKSSRKIQKAITWMLFLSKRKFVTDQLTGKKFSFMLNFITLTLPATQVHTDQEIKDKCLNNFLTVIRKKGVKNYIWRAEAQPMTGNIHFHITTDTYIHYNDLRKWWNQSLELLGYISAFEFKHKHRNPNSTDVHSVKHVRNLAAYVSKYISKNKPFPCIGELRLIEGETKEILYKSEFYRLEKGGKKTGKVIGHMLGERVRNIEGRLWGCSSSLSNIKNVVFDGQIHNMQPISDFIEQSPHRKFTGQWVDSYFFDVATESKEWFPQLYELLQATARKENNGKQSKEK